MMLTVNCSRELPATVNTCCIRFCLLNTTTIIFKALHDSTAAYLIDDCQLVSHAGRRRLRSARAMFHGPAHGSATGALLPLDRGYGTVCRPGFASPTMTLENFVSS